MLKGISPLISPDLLAVLARMGHGDEIVLADAHFPGESIHSRVLRADGLRIADLLGAIMPLFTPDQYYAHPLAMMAAVPATCSIPRSRNPTWRRSASPGPTSRRWSASSASRFYDRAKTAYAVVMTGETAKYATSSSKKASPPAEALPETARLGAAPENPLSESKLSPHQAPARYRGPDPSPR